MLKTNQEPKVSQLHQPRPLVVLGSFRGGTSATCGVLRELGVFVGNRFWHCSYGTYEAVGLRTCIDKCFNCRNQNWEFVGSYEQRVFLLRQWMEFARCQAAQRGCYAAGGKNPLMCMLVDEIAEAWKGPRGEKALFISVQRPKEEILKNWNRAMSERGWFPRKDRHRMVNDLIDHRDEALSRHDHITIEFRALRETPRQTITQLATQCGLPLDRLDSAIGFVEPKSDPGHVVKKQ